MLWKSMGFRLAIGGCPGRYRPSGTHHAHHTMLLSSCAFGVVGVFWLHFQHPDVRTLSGGSPPHERRTTSASACTHICRPHCHMRPDVHVALETATADLDPQDKLQREGNTASGSSSSRGGSTRSYRGEMDKDVVSLDCVSSGAEGVAELRETDWAPYGVALWTAGLADFAEACVVLKALLALAEATRAMAHQGQDAPHRYESSGFPWVMPPSLEGVVDRRLWPEKVDAHCRYFR